MERRRKAVACVCHRCDDAGIRKREGFKDARTGHEEMCVRDRGKEVRHLLCRIVPAVFFSGASIVFGAENAVESDAGGACDPCQADEIAGFCAGSFEDL